VQLGERQVKRLRWPWLVGATAVLMVAVLAVVIFGDYRSPEGADDVVKEYVSAQTVTEEKPQQATVIPPATANTVIATSDTQVSLDSGWLDSHQSQVWHGLAQIWLDADSGMAVQASCDGDNGRGYACLRDQGSWSKIKRIGLPVVLVLHGENPSYLLLRGVDEKRLLVGAPDNSLSVSKDSVDARWLGTYFVAWPQAPEWPAEVHRGDSGPAVTTIMEMASRVEVPYYGGQMFDAAFELWLKGFQIRNGLQADGIVGRNTLLYLMTASIEEPSLLLNWK